MEGEELPVASLRPKRKAFTSALRRLRGETESGAKRMKLIGQCLEPKRSPKVPSIVITGAELKIFVFNEWATIGRYFWHVASKLFPRSKSHINPT